MILRDKIILWLLAITIFFVFLHHIKEILFPFIAAIIISYFLNPLANRLERLKISRTFATLIILTIFISGIIAFFILIIPILYNEFLGLVNSIPNYYHIFLEEFYPKIVNSSRLLGYEINEDFKQYFNQGNISKLFNFSDNIFDTITRSSAAIINALSLIFITPILVFYILKDWPLLVINVNKLLPSKYAPEIRKIFYDIDKNLSGYIRGQFNVCFILGIIYALGLLAVGLNFGVLIGFLTGLFSFVPYVGMLIGVTVAVIVGFFQWGFDVTQIGLLAIVFVFGQFIESSFLTPKLIGKKIGLHPVWVIFAVFTFGILFGFVGILLAVPLAAVVSVIINFFLQKYKKNYINNIK